MQYYGLLKRIGDNEWIPTEEGIAFYYGEHKVLAPVATLANKVLPDDHDAWKTHIKKRQWLKINSVLPNFYKRRQEYQAEKSNQMRIV